MAFVRLNHGWSFPAQSTRAVRFLTHIDLCAGFGGSGMEVVLHADGWVHADGVSVRGRAFDGSDRLEASAICRRLGEALEGGRADPRYA